MKDSPHFSPMWKPWVSGIRDVRIGDPHRATTGAVHGAGHAPRDKELVKNMEVSRYLSV